MTASVFLAVLGAALMHAVWNALIKVRLDPFTAITLMTLGIGVVALCFLPFVAMPEASVWPFILLSIGTQNGYRIFLSKAYAAGDLSLTYALARGTAPVLVALAGVAFLHEVPSALSGAGILLLCMGTLAMSLRGSKGALANRAVVFALVASAFIAGYTLADGHGARLATDALSYLAWLFATDACLLAAICLVVRGPAMFRASLREWGVTLLAGVMAATSYGIAVWAMTKAPVAAVAALRETAILFAVAISVVFLREAITAWRLAAALLIVAGMVALRLG